MLLKCEITCKTRVGGVKKKIRHGLGGLHGFLYSMSKLIRVNPYNPCLKNYLVNLELEVE